MIARTHNAAADSLCARCRRRGGRALSSTRCAVPATGTRCPPHRYGPLDYRTAARTLFLRPYLAHFCSFFRRFFAVLSVLTPGFQEVAPKDRGTVPQRSETAEERVVAADQFLVDRWSSSTPSAPSSCARSALRFSSRSSGSRRPRWSWGRRHTRVGAAQIPLSSLGPSRSRSQRGFRSCRRMAAAELLSPAFAEDCRALWGGVRSHSHAPCGIVRVVKGDHGGVQKVAGVPGQRRGALRRRCDRGWQRQPSRTVQRVADERVAGGGQMNPDLVRTSCLNPDGHQRRPLLRPPLQHAAVGRRGLPSLCRREQALRNPRVLQTQRHSCEQP